MRNQTGKKKSKFMKGNAMYLCTEVKLKLLLQKERVCSEARGKAEKNEREKAMCVKFESIGLVKLDFFQITVFFGAMSAKKYYIILFILYYIYLYKLK